MLSNLARLPRGVTSSQYCTDYAQVTRGPAQKVLSSRDEFLVLELVLGRPGVYLHEICQEMHSHSTTGTHVSEATICTFLQKASFIDTAC